MPIGRYSVTVEAPQFGTLVQQPVQVNVSQAVRVNVQLELASVNETVTVDRRRPTGRYLEQHAGPRRHGPRARRSAAERP